MNIAGLHGFNVRDGGKKTVDCVGLYAIDAGYNYDYDQADYGYFNLWMIRLSKSEHRANVLKRIVRAVENSDVIIMHSNGSNFGIQALNMLDDKYAYSKIAIHISPALDCDTPIPRSVKAQLVLHTPHDFWVKLSSYLLFNHPWGRMGANGYTGFDKRNTNIRVPEVKGHSKWFHVNHIFDTWKHCNSFIKENRNATSL